MTNKLTSKLVSIFLTVAICVTTVFGCLVTASAENTASYVITGAQCVEGDTLASAIVEFSVPQGIAGGRFTIDNTNGWYESVAVTPYGDITESTDIVDVTTEGGNVVFNITDDNGDAISYAIVAFKLDFVFSSPISDDIEITISDVDLNGIYPNENYSSFANNSTNSLFSAGCQHKFAPVGEPVYSSTDPEYTVYSQAICSVCGEGKSDYQVVPSIEKDEGEVVIFSGAASSAKPVELLDPSNPVNSESNPYIIELPVQLLALSRGVLKNTNDEEVSAGGYYYKVKDGIKAFVMQGVDAATANTIMSLSSTDEVNAYFAGAATKTTYWGLLDSSKTFNGHFDGNGVEIYGIYSPNQATALFTQVSGTSSIKNFTLKNSYIAASSGAGVAAIVGKTPNDTNVDLVVIENIVIANNYIEQTGNQAAGANAIVGICNSNTNSTSAAGRDFVKIYNCLVYDNELVNNAYTGNALKSGLVGECSGLLEIKNVIALGVTPWTLNAGGWYLKQINDGTIANVYTDASQADWDAYSAFHANNTVANAAKFNINYALDVNALKGDAAATTASALNWNTEANPDGVWFTGNAGQYPTLLKGSETLVADSSDYAWKLLGVNLTYKNDGGFAINFHYLPKYNSDVALYVTNASKNANTKVLTNSTESSLAGTVLPAGAKMFTLDNLSARDISVLWLATIVTTSADSSTVVYSETKQISIGDYAEDVVLGDAFYDQNASSSEKTLDKTVAAALINYASASEGALSTSNSTSNEGEVVIFSGAASSAKPVELLDPSNPVNSESNPYIIELPVQLLALSRGVLKNTNDEEVSAGGYYYKVKDGIKAFVMQGVDAATANTIMSLSSADEVNAYFAGAATKTTYWGLLDSSKTFNGHFDGNGVEIYGIYSSGQATALFTQVSGTSSIKNLTLKNSYISANSGAGVATIVGKTPNDTNVDSVVIENIVVANNYIEQTGNQVVGANALVGMGNSNTNSSSAAQRDAIKVYNCLVYDNKLVNNAYTGNALKSGLVGDCTGLLEIKNVIALGVTPWTLNAGGWYLKQINDGSIANVYTDASQADWDAYAAYNSNNTAANATKYNINYALDADSFKGSAAKQTASVLDWEKIWSLGDKGKYPSIVLTDAKSNPISVYSGTPDTTTLSGNGTQVSPYIIKSADQFAAVALGKVKYAQGSYFKVDPSIKAFYLNGGATVASMTSVAEVEAYFQANGGNGWTSSWGNTNANEAFSGHFDGSGVTIYGLYDNDGNAGLFEMAEDSSSFKNFALKNSYISVSSGAGVAALVGKVSKQSDPDIMSFENIIVANNHIEQRNTGNTGASIVLGYIYNSNDGVSINKCIIYGNNIVNANPNTTNTGLVSTGGSGSADLYRIRNVVALGVKPYTAGAGYYLRVLDANKCFVNIYTDQDCSGMNNYSEANKNTYNFHDDIDETILNGKNAITALGDEFEWNSVWFAGNYNEAPSLVPAGSMPSNIQSQYDGVSFDITDALGNGAEYTEKGTMSFGVYQTALSLKANPYMSFAFAFHGDYKTNRDKIKIRFTYTENGATKTSDAISVPAYTGADIKNVNGWTNTSANGRYHTYKAENIPVEALAYGIKVEASYNGGAWVDFGTYSASGLGQEFERLNRNNPSEYYEARVEAVKALLFYAQAIAARYGA